MQELNIYKRQLVITVYFQLKDNDDQGTIHPIRTRRIIRKLDNESAQPSAEIIRKAQAEAAALVEHQVAFQFGGSMICHINNTVPSLEITYI